MRLFTAIRFNPETCARLLALCEELHVRSRGGRFSAPENLHLTLVFLGECDEQQAAAAKAAMDLVHFDRFSIAIESVGRFKRGSRAIWWAGVGESKPLLQLQQELASQLTLAGFALEQRKYSPHITLGREIITDVPPWPIEPFGEMVDRIVLMKSEQIGGKLIYTPIYEKRSAD